VYIKLILKGLGLKLKKGAFDRFWKKKIKARLNIIAKIITLERQFCRVFGQSLP